MFGKVCFIYTPIKLLNVTLSSARDNERNNRGVEPDWETSNSSKVSKLYHKFMEQSDRKKKKSAGQYFLFLLHNITLRSVGLTGVSSHPQRSAAQTQLPRGTTHAQGGREHLPYSLVFVCVALFFILFCLLLHVHLAENQVQTCPSD